MAKDSSRRSTTSASRRVSGQSTVRNISGRVTRVRSNLSKRDVEALNNAKQAEEDARLAGLTNAERHAEEGFRDMPDNDATMFSNPLEDILDGTTLADISHAGQDFNESAPAEMQSNETLWQALRDSHNILYGRRRDYRTRRDRTQAVVDGFRLQMTTITDAYMDWSLKSKDTGMGVLLEGEPDEMVLSHLPLLIIDVFTAYEADIPMFARDKFVASGLINLGLVPCSPYGPTVAITIRTLEVFRVTRLRCPRLGIQPYVRALCDIHGVAFRSYLSTQFSIAFDVYLATLAEVEKRIQKALGRDTPNWRLKNACPPCMYKLEGEPELLLPLLTTMDGNNSLRRFKQTSRPEEDDEVPGASKARKDDREVPGDYYLLREEVDKWAKEGLEDLMKGYSLNPEWVEEEDGCSERWSNMREEITSRALGMYDETGIFLSLCRHGFVLVVTDMIQSGELAKYGFAVVNHLIHVLGEVGDGYDIGCKFAKMVNAHPVLGPLARENKFRSLVGAFHGHAHNRRCQLCNLAIYVEGVGLEDLEECETFFSKSNALAASTRYATAFHRKQAITTYFKHTDVYDTYQALSLLLTSKYKRALEVKRGARTLQETMKRLGIPSAQTFVEWLAAEKAFLAELSHEPIEETLQMEYYQKLVNLRAAEDKLALIRDMVAIEDPGSQQYERNVAITRRLETQRRQAIELRDNLLVAVHELEARLDITERWQAGCEQWSAAALMVSQRRYQRALDNLHGLVIARLFELTKCNMSGTACSRAIKTAIEQYNSAAATLDVPREPLSWEEVVDYTFLSDFDLLRFARTDIASEGWAQPAGREAMDQYFKLLRADEEIKRLNIEIPRLVTYMRDEEAFLERQEARVLTKHSAALAHQVSLYAMRQGRFNDSHRCCLLKLANIEGFSGAVDPSVAVNKERLGGLSVQTPAAAPRSFDEASLGDDNEDDDETEADALEAAFTVLRVTEDPAQ
ncbi:hypothetical protein FB451DRAFT_1284595 [Mycena latifolia]|nr:hypothetical protein FB451DRAFT_1284595 [Mycena latifolia]